MRRQTKDAIQALCIWAVVLWAFVFITGCANDYRKYQLSDGKVVECADRVVGYCGLKLSVCLDHQVYHCQINVKEIR